MHRASEKKRWDGEINCLCLAVTLQGLGAPLWERLLSSRTLVHVGEEQTRG